MNRIAVYILAAGMLIAFPAVSAIASQTEPTQTTLSASEPQEINVSANGGTLRVTGAARMTLKIYYVTGTQAATHVIENDDQLISTGLAKGVYVVKVGKFVRKLTIS